MYCQWIPSRVNTIANCRAQAKCLIHERIVGAHVLSVDSVVSSTDHPTTYIWTRTSGHRSFQYIFSLMSSPINHNTVRNILMSDLSLTINDTQLYPKLTLTRHTKAVNALAISPDGTLLLSGGSLRVLCLVHNSSIHLGNDSRVVIWNLASGEMTQEFCVPSAGFVSCLAWIKLSDRGEDTFIFGASDGNIHLYERRKDAPLFAFRSIILAHEGAIEGFAWDSVHCRLASVGSGEVKLWNVSPESSEFYSWLSITDSIT